MVQNAFSVPGAKKPEHIFYDTNCLARQQAEKSFPWFKDIGIVSLVASHPTDIVTLARHKQSNNKIAYLIPKNEREAVVKVDSINSFRLLRPVFRWTHPVLTHVFSDVWWTVWDSANLC
jgi:hypothetical protein